MQGNDVVRDGDYGADPLAAMGLDDQLLRRAGNVQSLMTTAWFCTLYTYLARCCN